MSDQHDPQSAPPALDYGTPAFAYVVLCGVSLVVLLLLLLQRGQGSLVTLLILFVGGVGILTRMSPAPVLLLVLVTLSMILNRFFGIDARWRYETEVSPPFRLADVLLAAALLGYVLGHYRLQALHRYIFPPDYRLTADRPPDRSKGQRRRSVHLITPAELALLIMALPAFALVGQLAWYFLDRPREILDWDPWIVRLTVLIVVIVSGLLVGAMLLGYWRLRLMTPQEARLLMQDSLWRETRGEQRWFTRWLAWFWLKEKERKEQE